MPKRQGKKFGRRYPWRDWFKQGKFLLTKGVDYNGRTDTMCQQVRNAASRLGVLVSISTGEEGRSLRVEVKSVVYSPGKHRQHEEEEE